jgi:hypothetical protein
VVRDEGVFGDVVADEDGGGLCVCGGLDFLGEEGALGEGGELHLLEGAGGEDFEEHEAAVVGDALGGDGGGLEGDAAEGFDGVDVELGG